MTPPDEGQGGMDAGLPAPAQVTARVASLVERGLERYGSGDLAGALGEWEHALALDPSSAQAKEYIEYVRENFATLDEQFRAASAIKDSSRAAGVPMPEEPEEVSGAYDLVELDRGQTTPVGGQDIERALRRRENGDLDEGWGMDDLAAPLPPPPVTPQRPLASTLDEDLAEVAAGLQIRDSGAPIPTLASDEDKAAGGEGEGEGEGEGDEEPGRVVEMDADEPEPESSTQTQTVPGGQEPPPLPDHPELSAEAIAALGGRVPTVTIQPRARTGGEGTSPGYGQQGRGIPEDAQTPIPGELPAPPHVATPSELVLELGSLDSGVSDDRAQTERGGDGPEYDDRSRDGGSEDDDGISIGIVGEPGESDDDSPSLDSLALPPGVGEPVGSALLGLGGDDTGEATHPAHAKRSLELLPEDLPTLERHAADLDSPSAGLPGDESIDLGDADFDDQPRTAERLGADAGPRSPFAGDIATGFTEGADGRAVDGSSPGSPAVIVDEQLLRGVDDSGDEITNARARLPSTIDQMGIATPGVGARAESEAPTNARNVLPGDTNHSDEDRIRRRVSELLSLAREAAERGDHLSAVEAAEAASSEDPDGKVGPVILHRHRDLLYRVYEGHIGEMTQVPLLAVPLHQIAAERLDHRTGFLLSRIDGLLSFEDILDVAGMPRLDAYRILSNLLRRGFIEVR